MLMIYFDNFGDYDDDDDYYQDNVKSGVGQIEPINLKFQIRLLSDKIRVYPKEHLF